MSLRGVFKNLTARILILGNGLRHSSFLPLAYHVLIPMFIQMSSILFLAKVMTEDDEIINLPEHQEESRKFLNITRRGLKRPEVNLSCRLVNRFFLKKN